MLDEFIKLSQRGDALWISDVRKAFAAEPDAYRAVIRLECLDGTLRDYACPLPAGKTRPSGTFSPNISPPAFSTFSRASAARALHVYLDLSAEEPRRLAEGLPGPRSRRRLLG